MPSLTLLCVETSVKLLCEGQSEQSSSGEVALTHTHITASDAKHSPALSNSPTFM